MASRTVDVTLVSARDLRDVNLVSKMEWHGMATFALFCPAHTEKWWLGEWVSHYPLVERCCVPINLNEMYVVPARRSIRSNYLYAAY
uniref:Uncharacterized protein n=1 Tax=Aegilops tauschii TaxID=37682 RepID=N1QYP6_AEGTA